MYARDTILARKEPFVAPDLAADPPVDGNPAYIYNHVRVVGPSPIARMGGPEQWEGVGARGVVIEPLDGFGGTVDRPLGELQRDYYVDVEPDPVIVTPSIRVIDAHTRDAGPTPEDVFRELGDKPSTRRGRKAAA